MTQKLGKRGRFETGSKKKIILFTRYPVPGECKTRLVPLLGEINAACLQERMTRHIIGVIKAFCEKTEACQFDIQYAGGSAEKMYEQFGPHIYRRQAAGSLGNRMYQAFSEAFSEGTEQAVVIGSDIVDVTVSLLEDAFAGLMKNDLVLGPAADGGYYLIGMKKPFRQLFSDAIPWGTPDVCEKTIKIAKKQGLACSFVERLCDVDTPDDLLPLFPTPFLKHLPEPLISVIIPTLNEAGKIAGTIQSIPEDFCEIIISDGDSQDHTREIARKMDVTVVNGTKGRGPQQNFGADQAKGNILLFLHADTRLPENFTAAVLKTLCQPNTAAGAFKLKISGPSPLLRMVQFFTNVRSSFLQLPYGDQAFFLLKGQFDKAGGFPDMPVMEDYVMIRKLSGLGRIRITSESVVTSGRRWEKTGVLKTFLINQLMILGFYLNINIKKLEKFYRTAGSRK